MKLGVTGRRDIVRRIVAGSLLLACGCRERTEAAAVPTGSALAPPPIAVVTPTMYGRVGPGFADVISRARPSIVAVRAGSLVKNGPAAMYPASAIAGGADGRAGRALGSGFIVDIAGAPGLWVITTEQIARAAPELRVVLGDVSEVPARVVGVDSRLGIALLAVADATSASDADSAHASKPSQPGPFALSLGNSDDVHVGEWITALGDPFGEGAMATVGTISSLGAAPGALATADGDTAQANMPLGFALHNALGYRSFFVTDARIHRGNSGGAVLDTAGNVIGMAILPADGGTSNELAFIVPINRIKEVLAPLRERGTVTRAWLGALVQPVTPDQAATANLPNATGALVTEIKTGSPAAKSPLRVGDIILRWDDRSVDHRTLPYVVSASIPGKAVAVQIWRGGAATTITVAPEQMPE